MLKLKKVDLLGFKSFCERTHITFSGSGITCIVGPNGCGKSNVVDAISWVLGEQSHKLLRAERMADCIFNGTAKRAPLGMTEVSLTLVDPELGEAAAKVLEGAAEAGSDEPARSEASADATLPCGAEDATERPQPEAIRTNRPAKPAPRVKPGEIVIGRRLYRSGQSEYLINGRVARLRDIQEIFMGMGLGPDSYAIIEQGRIGQILSSKPMDRRAILEEAAGVSKYKTKRRLAEAKLESSKLNLARVNDILAEVEKQLASLKRQASKARRYAELREQMRTLLRQVLASKATQLDAQADRISQLLREISSTEHQQTRALQQLEAEQERLGARSDELESELRQNQNLLGQSALELDRAENRIGFNRERIREVEARSQQGITELEQAAGQAAQLVERARAHQCAVAALREDTARLQDATQALADHFQALAGEQRAAEAHIEELRQAASRWGEELTHLHRDHAQAEEALAHHAEAQARLERVERQLQTECAQQHERAQAAEAYWQAAEQQARHLEQTVCDGQTRLAELRREHRETTERFERVREELAGVRARRASLEQILTDRSYAAEAVQKLFAADGEGAKRGFRAVGVLADYAEVAEQYESAVEQFLRDELESIVVETFDHARAGIALLREEVGGRATFFVDSLRHLDPSPDEPPMPFRSEEGVVSRLDRLVEFRGPLGAVAKQFLPKLQSAFVVETAAVAEQLADTNPQYHFLTLDGTCYHGRLVSGGRRSEAGPLGTKRELRVLESQSVQLARAAEKTQHGVRRLEDERSLRERSLEETLAQHLEAEKALVAATHQRDQGRVELARLGHQLAECQKEIARLHGETEAARERAAQARQQQAKAGGSRAAAETEIVQAAERLAILRQEIQTVQEQLAARRADLAALAERLASAEALEQRLADQLGQVREREKTLSEQRRVLTRERAELESQTAEQECQAYARTAEKARLEERKVQLEQEWEQVRVRAVQVDDTLRMTRLKLGELREQRGQREIERARNDADRNHLRDTCLAELNAHPEDLIAQEMALVAGEELAAAEAHYRDLKARLEAMGPVNMIALEEYRECDQRCTFLTRERDDLLQSIADTQQAIAELNEVSRQKFEQAFQVINGNFADAFRALFGGGTGEMRLTEPDSAGENGIDIVAQPPGKRLQNVLLLSGGEKALTALALLIAIFRYQPSPFCILDEVDAPLDEANVGRFIKMLQEMSEQTQFIIVTHNRRTMEMAPVLYGVTMQEPGVSKLVSVRWDEPGVHAA